jgi:hypothetical protein
MENAWVLVSRNVWPPLNSAFLDGGVLHRAALRITPHARRVTRLTCEATRPALNANTSSATTSPRCSMVSGLKPSPGGSVRAVSVMPPPPLGKKPRRCTVAVTWAGAHGLGSVVMLKESWSLGSSMKTDVVDVYLMHNAASVPWSSTPSLRLTTTASCAMPRVVWRRNVFGTGEKPVAGAILG